MLTFLLVIQTIVTAALVGVILMQRSEGGGLGMGGSPAGLMSARGAADFLTRSTTILATIFVALSILSAVVASRSSSGATKIDTSLARQAPAAAAPAPGNAADLTNGAVPANAAVPAVPLGGESTPAPAAPAQPLAANTAPAKPVVTKAPAQARVVADRPAPVERAAPRAERPVPTPAANAAAPVVAKPYVPATTQPAPAASTPATTPPANGN